MLHQFGGFLFFIFHKVDKFQVCCYTCFMKRSESNELKQKLKRLGLFMLIVFLPAMVVAILLQFYAHVPQWLNILVLVVMLFVLYFLYVWICSKIDKKKQERLSKKKDPFS